MIRPRPAVVLAALLVPVAVLALAPAALAKGEIQARLDRAIPKDAAPGSTITVSWTIGALEGTTWQPIGADGVFIRLIGNAADSVSEARGTPGRAGQFSARIVVPKGGVATIWIGADESCVGPTCVHSSENLFPVVGVGTLPAVVPAGELVVSIDPLPALGPPFSEVDVTLRATLRPGIELGDRVLPGTLLVRAVDSRTGLATYEAATPIGQGRYAATVPLTAGETISIEAGLAADDRIALERVLTPRPLVLDVPAAPVPTGDRAAATRGASPAATAATSMFPIGVAAAVTIGGGAALALVVAGRRRTIRGRRVAL